MLDDSIKFSKAIENLKPSTGFSYHSEVPTTEELFDEVEWITGVAANDTAIITTVNPHSELTWEKVDAEMNRLQAEYDAQDYARKREAEYPSIQDLVVALYDTEDKTAIDAKRAEIKLKYPKPGA